MLAKATYNLNVGQGNQMRACRAPCTHTTQKKQGQIFEIQSRIQHLLVPMAHSQSVYMSNMIKNYEAAAGPRSAAPENTPIKVLQSVALYVALYFAVCVALCCSVFCSVCCSV